MALVRPARGQTSETRAFFALILVLTALRLAALFRTPLNLYPDEAQYWLWSRSLDFGYFSKPPMVAWAIWATTALGGESEAWVRLSAPLFQAGAALAAFALGRRLYGPKVGLAAGALYALAPAIQLSGLVIATDAPLLFFLGLTILAYAALQQARSRLRLALAAGFGAGLGLAFLSKYAAAYALIGIGLHLALDRGARRAWSPAMVAAAALALAAVLAPNLAWNAQHGFATLHSTAADAGWSGRRLFNPAELGEFLASQFGVFGPIPFGALIAGVVLATRRRKLEPADRMLLCFVLPPLLIVSLQAFISRANANWAAAAYLPGAVLAAAWLVRWNARRWLAAALVLQGLAAAAFLAFVVDPQLADRAGVANSLKRARGWDRMSAAIVERARQEPPGSLSAVTVNNRFLYYALAYYGRDFFRQPGAPPLKAWVHAGQPQTQAEVTTPLTAASGRRVLVVAYNRWKPERMMGDFARTDGLQIVDIGVDRKRQRRMELFIGEGYRPETPASASPETVSSDPTQP